MLTIRYTGEASESFIDAVRLMPGYIVKLDDGNDYELRGVDTVTPDGAVLIVRKNREAIRVTSETIEVY